MTGEGKRTMDIVVLGGGIVGTCCALELTRAGRRVCLVDADFDREGASSGNAGVISPWSIIPQSTPGLWRRIPGWVIDPDGPVSIRPGYAPRLLPWAIRFLAAGRFERVLRIADAMAALNRDNVSLYRSLLTDAGQPELLEDSYYIHAFRQPGGGDLSRLEYRIRARYGADLEIVDGHALADIEPAVATGFSGAILIKGQARARSPGRVLSALRDDFGKRGGETLLARIESLLPADGGGWHIVTDHGPLKAKTVVLSMGAWSARLLTRLGIRVPLEAERGYHVVFEAADIRLNHSFMDVDRKLVASSMTEGIRVAGSAEFTGLDRPPTRGRIDRLVSQARQLLPAVGDAPVHTWMGHRPSFPDGLPVVCEVPGKPGLFAAFGHSHYGLMMAPRTGRLVRDLVLGNDPGMDTGPLSIERFL